jgi:hypothetical protein
MRIVSIDTTFRIEIEKVGIRHPSVQNFEISQKILDVSGWQQKIHRMETKN